MLIFFWGFVLFTASPFFCDDGSASHPSGVPPRHTPHEETYLCFVGGAGFLFINASPLRFSSTCCNFLMNSRGSILLHNHRGCIFNFFSIPVGFLLIPFGLVIELLNFPPGIFLLGIFLFTASLVLLTTDLRAIHLVCPAPRAT